MGLPLGALAKKLAKWLVKAGIEELNKEIDSHNVRRPAGVPAVAKIPAPPSTGSPGG